jgi:hypothetical protein
MPPQQATPFHVQVRIERRDAALKRLGYSGYNAYLASPAWRAVRFRYIEERPWICHVCGKTEKLYLHHRTYERVGQEQLDDLMPLCDPCHGLVHSLEREGRASLDFQGVIDEERALEGRAFLADLERARRIEREERIASRRALIKRQPLEIRVRLAVHAAKQRHWPPIRYRSQARCAARCVEKGHKNALRTVEVLELLVYGQPL